MFVSVRSLPTGYIVHAFCRLLILLRNSLRVSSSLDPDQAPHFVGPHFVGPEINWGSNCLQKLSVDDTTVKKGRVFKK